MIAVALDEAEAAREWIEAAAPTYPCLIDADHVVADRYGILNVPSVVWIDEEDRIVRPPDIVPVDDLFRSFTGIDSDVHNRELRSWVRDGTLLFGADDVRERVPALSADQEVARLERRVGAWLRRRGRPEAAERHFAAAQDRAPLDWTIRRGSLPLRGGDPFGPEFFAFAAEWDGAGRPGYGWGNSLRRPDPPA